MLAPAKINLWLEVVGRRKDGYHLLNTLMAPVSLYDTVRLRLRREGGIRLRTNDPGVPSGPENLAWRAASLLLSKAPAPVGLGIELVKRIPAGAGLGGGSSDAAAVLLGVDRLLGLRSGRARLATLAAQLGADIPFFVHGRPALVTGIGETVRPVGRFPTQWVVLVWPSFALSTAWIYSELRRRSLTKLKHTHMIRRSAKGRKPLRERLRNDLETVALAAHPELKTIKETILAQGAEATLMSGSGSACFGLFPSKRAAESAARRLRRAGFWAQAVHTIARGPLARSGRSPSW